MTPSEIIEHVSGASGISVERIMSRDRHAPVARARQVAMLLARELTGMSFPQLGEAFRRDGSTVFTGVENALLCIAADAGGWRELQLRALASIDAGPRWVPLNDDGGEGLGEW